MPRHSRTIYLQFLPLVLKVDWNIYHAIFVNMNNVKCSLNIIIVDMTIVTIKSHRSGYHHRGHNHYGDLHSQKLMNNFHWSYPLIIYHYGWVTSWLMRRIICWWALRADFHFNFRSGKLARKWLQFLLENMTNCLETFCNLFHNLWNSKQLLPKALYIQCTSSALNT